MTFMVFMTFTAPSRCDYERTRRLRTTLNRPGRLRMIMKDHACRMLKSVVSTSENPAKPA